MPSLKVVMPEDELDSVSEPRAEELRLLEAMLFASAEPLDEKELAARLPQGIDVHAALARLQEDYALRDDEDPLEPGDLDLGLAPPPERISEE